MGWGETQMTTIGIEDVHDIQVEASRTEIKTDYIGKNGNVIARVEMSRGDKELEIQRTMEALKKT
jgi:hypothetical protein